MPRDIRSYFSVGAASKKPSVISDDSPKKSSINEGKKAGGKKNRLVILDSDSEEDPLPPSPKRRKNSSSSGKKKPTTSKEKPNLVPVNIADVFGSKPVERVERKPQVNQSHKVQPKEEQTTDDKPSVSQVVPQESSDSDFSETISQRLQRYENIKSVKKEACEEDKSDRNSKQHEEGKKRSESEVEEKHERVKIEKTTPKKASDLEKKRQGSASKGSVEKEVKSVAEDDGSEKKKQHAIMYQKYLHREGPKHPGSKKIPKGHPNCLNGLVFVITGVLDSLDRDEASSLVQSCGGKVTSSVSRKTSYIVLGDEPGPAKLEKAKNLGIKQLDEDGLLDLIKTRSNDEGSIAVKIEVSPSSGKKRRKEEDKESLPFKAPKVSKHNDDGKAAPARKLNYSPQESNLPSDSKKHAISRDTFADTPKEIAEMWVDKYKPSSTKQIIGQQGDKSNVNTGHPNCLNGLVFVITGVLDSLDRDEASSLVQSCGGKVTASVSRNTSYIVLGDEPGPAKLEKAKNLGIKQLDEDGLLDLIKTRSNDEGSIAVKIEVSPSSGRKRRKEEDKESLPFKAPKVSKHNEDGKAAPARKLNYSPQESNLPSDSKTHAISRDTFADAPKEIAEMWVDKYKPSSTKQIIGQQGDKSNVNKLKRWLSKYIIAMIYWHKYHGKGGSRPPRPGPWDKNDDGGYYKAALLSGPPGIGKTTSAHLVCEELGMDAIELNASDTRSKKLLELEVAELVTNLTLSSFFTHGL